MNNDKLINVFKDTKNYSIDMNKSVTTKHTFLDSVTIAVTPSIKNNILVVNSDSVTALEIVSKLGKSCVLNMASPSRPGGGVENGAKAQEECLFRCSNLFNVISNIFYPLVENQALYTKDAIFFKDVNYDYMDEIVSDVITIAAMNLNEICNYDNSYYIDTTKNKIKLMLSLAINNNVENIVIGAWGCGVFKNNPEIISNLFYNILVTNGYADLFKNVVFAIINDNNSVGDNFDIFDEKFK